MLFKTTPPSLPSVEETNGVDYFNNTVQTLYFPCLAGRYLSSHSTLHGYNLSDVFTLLLFHDVL